MTSPDTSTEVLTIRAGSLPPSLQLTKLYHRLLMHLTRLSSCLTQEPINVELQLQSDSQICSIHSRQVRMKHLETSICFRLDHLEISLSLQSRPVKTALTKWKLQKFLEKRSKKHACPKYRDVWCKRRLKWFLKNESCERLLVLCWATSHMFPILLNGKASGSQTSSYGLWASEACQRWGSLLSPF